MNDAQKREMLEAAARAAGMNYLIWTPGASPLVPSEHRAMPDRCCWNPLEDDGDALRLAVRLNLHLRPLSFLCPNAHEIVVGVADWYGVSEKANGDPYAATRLAITRAAAEIGRQMQSAERDKDSE